MLFMSFHYFSFILSHKGVSIFIYQKFFGRLSLLKLVIYFCVFSEWVEFSPFEIGMAKYGTFMPTELFGSKFFMGKLCKKFDEQPLHFLQGN